IASVAARVVQDGGPASGWPSGLTAADVARRMASLRGRGAWFVCRIDGRTAGFAALEPVPDERKTAALGVWVLPSSRRQGVGTQLALMALNFARGKGYRKVRGTLPAGNEAAPSFFGSIGALVPRVGGDLKYELPL
ncbi:MAG: GNAT family N-acetyltransferase, partial [Dehalococcoidia bacterium]